MNINGYELRTGDGTVVQRWTSIPPRIDLPSGNVVFGVKPDWFGEGMKFVETSWDVPDPPPPGVEVIRTAYLKAALAQLGKLDAVNAAVTDPVLRVLWENATEMRRDDPDMITIATALSIDLDDVWTRARTIRTTRGEG